MCIRDRSGTSEWQKPYCSEGPFDLTPWDYVRDVAPHPETDLLAGPRRVLLDAGSAPMLPSAKATLMAALDAGWADPQRLYAEGRQARALLDQARELLADGLGVRPPEVSFLPGGPAAIRAGLEGLRYAGRRRGPRMVATAVEHSAILTTGRYHAAQADNPLLFAEVGVDGLGRVDLLALEDAISIPGTVLAAVQSANGEIGTRQPLEQAHGLCPVSYTHLRAHETVLDLVCRLLLEKK